MKHLYLLLILCLVQQVFAQPAVEYRLNFENAYQNESQIEIVFRDIPHNNFRITMSRSSPGRYALHEFVKNVYNLKAYDSKGKELNILRPDPYSWIIPKTDGSLRVTYTLFANHADGTYSDINDSHAHLNIPATLIYAPELSNRKHRLSFGLRNDLNWKVATQLIKENDSVYTAPTLHYLMDSPVEISDHSVRSFKVKGPYEDHIVNFALHHRGTEKELDTYFEAVKAIVLEEIEVFGEAPKFDYNQYTFLACYLPWVNGDGMEHRNSTYVTSTRELSTPQGRQNLGTVAHEFFHSWNVERLRPKSLEPFDFTHANMSGELWFAEGFTSYYTNLILKRAGIMDEQAYLNSITPTFNYVWNSPARTYFSPVEMSQQAPFTDAARSVDPNNRDNTFISYYSYGHMLGLALDLQLRQDGLNLDDFFKLLWNRYGKTEKPYTLKMLQESLQEYAGKKFGESYFEDYIYQSKMPDYKNLFQQMGIEIQQESNQPYLGAEIDHGTITNYPVKFSPANQAGLGKGDRIVRINGQIPKEPISTETLLEGRIPGEEIVLETERYGKPATVTVTLVKDPVYSLKLNRNSPAQAKDKRELWLGSKRKSL